MVPERARIDRFSGDLDALAPAGARLGIALSGGADSLALLLLAAAARRSMVEAATVDHALRPDSRDEAQAAGAMCKALAVPHTILTAEWRERPASAIQERARAERYRLLAGWAEKQGLDAILTGHHADDQAETLLMRLNRGAGVHGLGGMRASSTVPGADVRLLRPLLGWRRSELERVCSEAGVTPLMDPSNADDRFERVRIRRALAEADCTDPAAIAASAAHLASADEALDWAADRLWQRSVSEKDGQLTYAPGDAPAELVRRIVARAVTTLASEGIGQPLRARELDPLLQTLASGGQATLRGVLCAGGTRWRFSPAPHRSSR